jgi:hypothetical protein
MKRMIKMKKQILASPAIARAIPVKPNKAAIRVKTKNVIAKCNMTSSFDLQFYS